MAHELAIVGLDCRFPGSRNVAEYWENLKSGVDCVSVADPSRLAASGLDPDYLQSSHFVGAAYEIPDIDQFDAAFFGIATPQAMVMSPQHRLILESAWSACEHAGYNPMGFKDDVGVFVGSDDNTYYLGLQNNPRVARIGAQRLVTLGNYLAYLPAWVAYKLNLKGPSLGIHAGCCTSLAAVHLACNSLLLGECRVAIVGAVAARVPQRGFYHYEPGGIESADGRCRPFDAAGTGTVYGNGVGTVVIKRLADALADRDTVHAVVKGSALNNDGSAKLSFAAPNPDSWAAVIAEALLNSGVHPESIGYVEAHGTGTTAGDAMEIEALTKAYRKHTERKGFCAVGSVKANIGHLEAAAGMASLIKVICILRNGLVPPAIHFATPNERIDFTNSPFFVSRTPRRWRTAGKPRRAAINSFGIGGGNAHLVLEEAPVAARPPAVAGEPHALLISARTAAALRASVADIVEYLQCNPTVRIEDVACTLALGREFFEHRCAVVCRSTTEAVAALAAVRPSLDPPIVGHPVFILPESAAATVELSRDLYARATLLISMGVKPAALIAWGKAQWVAAALSGSMELETALRLTAAPATGERGEPDWSSLEPELARQGRRLLDLGSFEEQGIPGGSPAPYRAVRLPKSEVRQILLAHLWSQGIEISRDRIDPGGAGMRIPLPTYPFERRTYWIDGKHAEPAVELADAGGPLEEIGELSTTEQRITQICRELLAMPSIDPQENFFDLGASSLQITQIQTRIREYLGVDLPLERLFEHASVRGLTAEVRRAESFVS